MASKINKLVLGSLLTMIGAGTTAMASPITYDVTVNTSSISGTTGSLDFNFNPGPLTSQSASLDITNFSSNGVPVGQPTLTGDVTGSLPSALTFDNGTAFNDYFGSFTYGSSISFDVTLSGPALTSPGGATSGSTFAFSMFSDTAGTVPALTTDSVDGFAAIINVNVDGSTTVQNFSPETTVEVAPVPLPPALLLFGSGIAAIFGVNGRRKKYS